MNKYEKGVSFVLRKLGLVTVGEHEKAVKEYESTVKSLRAMSNNDSRLAATLVNECRRMEEDNDRLADENADLLSTLKDIHELVSKVLLYPLFTPEVFEGDISVREMLEQINHMADQAINRL